MSVGTGISVAELDSEMGCSASFACAGAGGAPPALVLVEMVLALEALLGPLAATPREELLVALLVALHLELACHCSLPRQRKRGASTWLRHEKKGGKLLRNLLSCGSSTTAT